MERGRIGGQRRCCYLSESVYPDHLVGQFEKRVPAVVTKEGSSMKEDPAATEVLRQDEGQKE